MRACEHRLRVFLAGSTGDHLPLCRICVAPVVALVHGVAECRAPYLSPERYLCRAGVLLVRRHHIRPRLRMMHGAVYCAVRVRGIIRHGADKSGYVGGNDCVGLCRR